MARIRQFECQTYNSNLEKTAYSNYQGVDGNLETMETVCTTLVHYTVDQTTITYACITKTYR